MGGPFYCPQAPGSQVGGGRPGWVPGTLLAPATHPWLADMWGLETGFAWGGEVLGDWGSSLCFQTSAHACPPHGTERYSPGRSTWPRRHQAGLGLFLHAGSAFLVCVRLPCRSLILEAWPRAGAVCYHLLQPGWEGLCYWVRGLGRHDPCAGLRGRRAPRPRPWALHRDHQRRLPSSLSKSNKPGPTCSQTGFPWIPGGKRLWALGDAPGSRGNGCTPPVSPTKCQVLQPHRGPQPSTVSSSGHWEHPTPPASLPVPRQPSREHAQPIHRAVRGNPRTVRASKTAQNPDTCPLGIESDLRDGKVKWARLGATPTDLPTLSPTLNSSVLPPGLGRPLAGLCPCLPPPLLPPPGLMDTQSELVGAGGPR